MSATMAPAPPASGTPARAAPEPGPSPVSAPRAGSAGAVAAAFATAGAGMVLGALFDGWSASVLAALGAVVGAGLVALSVHTHSAATVQWLAAPVALAAGALAALAGGGAVGTTLPKLVRDALLGGGLSQPPVPFDPGWRFVLVSVCVLLGAGAASVALSTGRPKLGVAVALPVVALGAVAQPAEAGPLAAIAGLVGIVGGLVVAYGIEVAREDEDAGFQPRRLLRGAAAMAVLGVGLAGLASAASFLLPEPSDTRVIPPQRPPAGTPQEDVELFVVASDRVLPWRLGVLDVYDDGAWMTPPFDVARFVAAPGVGAAETTDVALDVTFTITELAGRALPALAAPAGVTSAGSEVLLDPRTDALRFDRLLTPMVAYRVLAPAPASGAAMAAAGPPSAQMRPFLAAPPPPGEVQALLAGVGPTESDFERLQAVRQVWYDAVVAAGQGTPVDLPPARVAAILRGDANGEATPYEIVAGEALLARWAGVPARIGYGWYGGDRVEGGWSVRPKHGAVWLEVHFEGSGWVPIVGRPPRAKGSLSDAPKNDDPGVRPTEELALITYVPIRRESVALLFEVVRHWAVRVVPAVLGLFGLALLSPVPRRAWRRRRGAKWAGTAGPRASVLAAYARMRDRAWDLHIGHPAQTPLEFADAVRPDDEHRELAWLVTRVLWGDLAATAGAEEVDAVRTMSDSVQQRLTAAQPGAARLVAATSRASLQLPYAPELVAASRHQGRLPWRRAVAATATVLLLGSCGQAIDLRAASSVDVLPNPLVPTQVDDVRLQREPGAEVAFEDGGPNSLVEHGRVYSVRVQDTIEASLQVAALRPGVADWAQDVREGILRELGGGRFQPVRIGQDSVLAVETNEQRLLLWFSAKGDWYQLLVARRSFDRADALFAAVLATQRGNPVTSLDELDRTARVDVRRGIP